MKNTQSPKGLFIIFEGTDGTGKSTQLQLLATELRKMGYEVEATREPTDGKYGKQIRALYTDRGSCSREEELELFIRDRKDHVDALILPAIEQGKIVLCDRYVLSTVAYQGAIGFDPDDIYRRNGFAPEPDIAFVFELSVASCLNRITASRGDQPNEFEQVQNLTKVASIFSEMRYPYICRIDATGSIGQISQELLRHVRPILPNQTNQCEAQVK